jgi:hypothetical protein
MGITKNLSRLGALLASLGVIAVAFAGAASASTAMIPVPGPPDTGSGTAGVIVVHTVAGGMPGWQIAAIAIAIAAALVAAVAAVLVDRVFEARRRLLGAPA